MPRITRFLTVFIAAVAVTVSTVIPVSAATASVVPTGTSAVTVAQGAVGGIAKTTLVGFNPGNIISDTVFTKNDTMTEAQIQAFLNSKGGTCRSGYTCLKDLRIATQSKSADKYCRAYAGTSSETAARIIYKVATACDINPQVLIVMLQKEQGLVTHTWPSDYRFNAAMGQACPDTAPCNVAFAGFFAQVYGAARQMQIYMEGRHFTWYAPGKTWNILYNPKASCGRGPVYVANKATSALYYYTPYQPNAAAMRAGYGTGDSCSAYGNRNFYNYFTDWFGSTQTPAMTPTGAIATEWKRMGAASGGLGSPAAPVQIVTDPNGNGRAQKFTGGWIHSSSLGTYSSLNSIMTAYSASGWLRGDLGWPITQTSCTNGACTQAFDGGIITFSSGKAAAASFGASGAAIDAEHRRAGGASGTLGAAAAPALAVADANGHGVARRYAGGWIHSSNEGAFASTTPIMTGYSAAGWLRGDLGWPIAGEQTVTDPNGNGVAQSFQGGWVHASSAGSFSSSSTIMKAYSAAGWLRGQLGWPIGPESCTGSACVQQFDGGIISYVEGKDAVTTLGIGDAAIADAIKKQTAVAGALTGGAAVQVVADPNGAGLAQKFGQGWVHSSENGTFVSSSTVMTAYSKAGWVRGELGWPTGVESCSGTLCAQPFEGGVISYSSGKPAVAMTGVGTAAVTTMRAASASGIGAAAAPVQVVTDSNGNGLARKYASGWMHASDKGTFSSSTRIMNGYSAAGWLRGALGWPTAAEQKITDKNGNGAAQAFEGGWIHSSDRGTFTSSTTIMTAYSAAGWVRGSLGWPIGPETCTGTGCVQPFAGGVIDYVKGKAAVAKPGVTAAAVTAAASKQTSVTGALGGAQAAAQLVADPNGAGLAQKFSKGWVHSSARGTFVSSTTVMTAYSAAGWVRGKLGWPTSEELCSGTACSQSFERGTISYTKGGAAVAKFN